MITDLIPDAIYSNLSFSLQNKAEEMFWLPALNVISLGGKKSHSLLVLVGVLEGLAQKGPFEADLYTFPSSGSQ